MRTEKQEVQQGKERRRQRGRWQDRGWTGVDTTTCTWAGLFPCCSQDHPRRPAAPTHTEVKKTSPEDPLG